MKFTSGTQQIALVAALVALTLLLVGTPTVLAQADIQSIDIVSLDASGFPDVSLQARILEQDDLAVQEISADTIRISENNNQVPFEHRKVDAGIQLALVADLGAGSGVAGASGAPRIEEIKLLMQRYVEGMGAHDTAMLIVQDASGTNVVQNLTGDTDELRAAISNLEANESTQTNGYASLVEALNRLGETNEISRAQAVLFFSTSIQSAFPTGLTDVEELAAEHNIPVHTVLSHSNPELGESVEQIASTTGGFYTHYQQPTDIEPIFNRLAEQRVQWDFTFRSVLRTSGERTVTIESASSAANPPRDSTTYSIELSAPTVTITSPDEDDVIRREAENWNQDPTTIPPTSTTVLAEITWPDDLNREVRTARLLVNNQEVALQNDPGANLNFNLELTPFSSKGENEVTVQVEATDELGFEATSPPTTFIVHVIIPPVPTTECVRGEGVLALAQWGLCELRQQAIGIAALILLIPTLIFAIIAWRNRGQLSAAAVRTGEAVTEFVARMTHPANDRRTAAAYVTVLRGDPYLMGKKFPIYSNTVTPIGRDRSQVEIVFPDEESSVISRKHCEIRQEDGEFKLRDFASTYGTYLNGTKLPELTVKPLSHGDEISLGPVARGGILLRFELSLNEANMPEEMRDTQPVTD